MTDYNDQHYQEIMQRIRGLRLIDDVFMTVCFDGNIEGAQLLLSIILDRDDLTVTEVKAQKIMKNLKGRDVWLDILATDKEGALYNVEVQRADAGADRKRARYHSSMLDSNMLAQGESWQGIRESYVIFITENDVLGLNKPIYHIERHIVEGDYLPFNDGEHIIYVNGAMKGSDTALAKLMSDFFCTEAKDMNYAALSEKVRYFKESEKGVERMFDSLEDLRNQAILEANTQTALKMIAGGKLSLEDIASYSGLPLDKVKELAEAKTA
ncbi:PD-(D/E)XK nuclease family transposase [Butyrivibrio sp. AE2032]|uniref:PD-(D/E)XK nuclease family transposase n=1 Tax=Butyrivibrio sp. AE2032 TaxID=1458463 RepID=UPI0005506610|nr:PD-(D/E)XK nuclease family transposase [Butyrivibrio sp. AE2032]